MNTKDNYGLVIFKWLATVISIAIAIPGMFNENTKVAFILTSCVFIFSKFIDNIEGMSKYKSKINNLICIIGIIVAIITIGFCFYYFAVIFNEIQIITTTANVSAEIVNNQQQGISSLLSTNINVEHYPLFESEFFYYLLFGALLFYFAEESLFDGCEFVKYFVTKNKIVYKKKRQYKIISHN